MAKRTDVNFDYISNQRYIVELLDETTGQIFYSTRICGYFTAWEMWNKFDRMKGFTAKLHDTKDGTVEKNPSRPA